MALFRLLFRWIALTFIVVVAGAFVLPVLFSDINGSALFFGWPVVGSRSAGPVARQLVLQLGATLPLTAATMASLAAQEMYVSSISWTLPNLRSRILTGHLVLLATITLAVSLLGFTRADAWTATLAAGLTLFWYAVGACWQTIFRRPWLATLCIVLAAVALLRPSWYAACLTWSPYTVLLVLPAVAMSVILLARHHGTAMNRTTSLASAAIGSKSLPTAMFFWGNRTDAVNEQFTGPRHTLWQWILAAATESTRRARSWVFLRAVSIVPAILFLYFGNTTLAIMGISFVQFGLQLSGQLAYPLSRRQRATLQYVCSLIDVFVVVTAVWSIIMVLQAVGASRLWFIPRPSTIDWRVELAALCVMVPVAQWSRATRPLPPTDLAAQIVPTMLVVLGATMTPYLLRWTFGTMGVGQTMLLLSVAIVVSQLLYFAALQFVYARRDLST
jgi:hypothetical protein